MVSTTIIADEKIAPKLDWKFIEAELKDAVNEDVVLSFVCANNDWRKEDTWTHKGKKFYRIVLPYEKVKSMNAADVRHLMLRLAEERLGLVSQS